VIALTVLCLLSPRAQTSQAPPGVALTFDHYHGYKETKALLDRLAAAYPALARVHSIGRDFKGYETWAIEITNQKTGPASEKPAFYADGNIDADEPSSTEVALYVAHRLLTQYGTDPALTKLVDTTAFYVVPTCNPYMSDLYVSTPMTGIVSSINARPRDDDDDGTSDEDPPDDVDGDGRILQMRVRDPRGPFKPHPRESRLMVRRSPDEPGEWIVHSEGLDNDGDGAFNEDWIGGVDLNRNFPFDWKPEWLQEGAGPYPLSEPESRNIVEFVTAHPNIGFVINGHSGPDDGLIYRPYGSRPDSAIPRSDFQTMGEFARKFASLSGGLRMLPPYGAEAERRFGPGRQVYGNGFLLEWAYEMTGAYSFVPEHGMIPGDADRNGRVSDEELLEVSDKEFGGKLFVPWKPFTHPTLGAVEIGGFVKFTKPNPPPGQYLERLVQTYGAMYLYLASALPRLALRDATATSEAGGFKVRAVVENLGLLPTSVTEKAIENHYAQPVFVTLTTGPGVDVVMGDRRVRLGHLGGVGFDYRPALSSGLAQGASSPLREASWIVRAPASGGWVEIAAATPKAGTVRQRVTVGVARRN
jgi:hypothetical protein